LHTKRSKPIDYVSPVAAGDSQSWNQSFSKYKEEFEGTKGVTYNTLLRGECMKKNIYDVPIW